jgi:cytochrome b561
MLRSSATRWGIVTRLLHWSMAILMIGLLWLGFTMVAMPLSLVKMKTYALHKSLGVTVLLLVLLRVLWRQTERTPEALSASVWQRRLAVLVQGALYAAMVVLPLSGWWYNSAAGFPLQVFGWFNLPHLVEADPAMKSLAHALHVGAVWVLIGALAAHVAGALKHHFIDRDDTFKRMIHMRRVG